MDYTYGNNEAVLIENMARVYVSIHYKEGLRPSQWEALRFFANNPGTPLSEFAKWRKSTMGTTSMTVSQLVERGLLTREGGRNVGIRPTALGKKLLSENPLDAFQRAIETLPAGERRSFRNIMEKIIDQVADVEETSANSDSGHI